MNKILNKIDFKMIAGGMLTCVIVLGAAYVFFVHDTVFCVGQRGLAENTIDELEVEVASLEGDYLQMASSKVNLAYAEALGFNDAGDRYSFVAANNNAISLSMINNEI